MLDICSIYIYPPMGVFLSNLPFIGLMVFAGVSLAGFFVFRLRNKDDDDEYEYEYEYDDYDDDYDYE